MSVLCDVMQVSRSGYYVAIDRPLSQKTQRENRLLLEVKTLAKTSHHSYGSRRMAKALQQKGYAVGRSAARSLMQKAAVECKQRRRYSVTTQSQHDFRIAENVLNREFMVDTPNRVWITDITYLWTEEGWLYLAGVVDLFSRRVVGWAMADHMREALIQDALQMALARRHPEPGLLHHSDRGVQYASDHYRATLKSAGILVSMSRSGNCWDNAVMERVWGSLKSERTDGKMYTTREEGKKEVIDYFEMFYNSIRLHSTLGYKSPMQFENEFLLKNVSTFT